MTNDQPTADGHRPVSAFVDLPRYPIRASAELYEPRPLERISQPIAGLVLLGWTALYFLIDFACVGPWTYPHEGLGVFFFFTVPGPISMITVVYVIYRLGLRFHLLLLIVFLAAMIWAFWWNGSILLDAVASV